MFLSTSFQRLSRSARPLAFLAAVLTAAFLLSTAAAGRVQASPAQSAGGQTKPKAPRFVRIDPNRPPSRPSDHTRAKTAQPPRAHAVKPKGGIGAGAAAVAAGATGYRVASGSAISDAKDTGGKDGPRAYEGWSISEQAMGDNLCAITFDDGPSVHTPRLLDMLDALDVRATFFMLGRNAQAHPDIVRQVVERGHEVANHSFSHVNFKTVGQARREKELVGTNEILRGLGGESVLFRPPYGAMDKEVLRLADRLGMRVVTWSHDSEDWKALPANYATLRSARGKVAKPGHLRGVFLFHDIHKTTVDDVPRMVAQLRAGGCDRFVTVSDFMQGLFIDPEPPMLLTRRADHRAALAQARRNASRSVKAVNSESLLVHPAIAGDPQSVEHLVEGNSLVGMDTSAPVPLEGRGGIRAWKGLALDDIRALTPAERHRYATLARASHREPETDDTTTARTVSPLPRSSYFVRGESLAADTLRSGRSDNANLVLGRIHTGR